MSTPVVGFAGMTHLGLISASAVAGRGFEVVCFDADPALIDRLNRRDWPVLEPGLDQLIDALENTEPDPTPASPPASPPQAAPAHMS